MSNLTNMITRVKLVEQSIEDSRKPQKIIVLAGGKTISNIMDELKQLRASKERHPNLVDTNTVRYDDSLGCLACCGHRPWQTLNSNTRKNANPAVHINR